MWRGGGGREKEKGGRKKEMKGGTIKMKFTFVI